MQGIVGASGDAGNICCRGYSYSSYLAHLKLFYLELAKDASDISIPSLGSEVYHLIYTKCSAFNSNLNKTNSKVSLVFDDIFQSTFSQYLWYFKLICNIIGYTMGKQFSVTHINITFSADEVLHKLLHKLEYNIIY